MTIDLENRVFSFNLLFRGMKNNIPSEVDLWEERLILVFSPTEEQAILKAKRIGGDEESRYKTIEGDTLVWKFIQIERMFEVNDFQLKDGIEIFSRYLRNSEIESILTPFEE